MITLLRIRTKIPLGQIGAVALLALSLFAGGCKIITDPERDPDDVPTSEVLALSRTGGDLPLRADGTTRDTLLAHIPAGSTQRVVTFTTTRGKFLLSNKQDLKVRAEKSGDPYDPRLVARAVLVADTIPGEAVVSASIGDFTAYLFVPFVD